MTNQEAIEYFKNKLDLTLNLQKGQTDRNALAISSRNIEAYELAIAALEKQEQKEANCIRKSDCITYYGQTAYSYTCPACGEEYCLELPVKICRKCGQHLKWSDGNDKQ